MMERQKMIKTDNLLAFSGGVDSSALFFMLEKQNISFDLIMVDYNVRKQSKDEVKYGKYLAEKFNKKIYIKNCFLETNNFEAKARECRYTFFKNISQKYGYKNLYLGHQLNDKFEWFLMQFSKGAGLKELIGMQEIEEREKFKFNKRTKNILKITAIILFALISIYVFVFLKIFFNNYKINSRLSGLEKIIFTTKQTNLEKKSLAFNQKINALEEALGKENIVSSLLLQLNQYIPAGITIKEININADQKIIEIKGIASLRKDILALEDSLSSLGKVNIPLSSFQDNKNIAFKASIRIKNKK